MSEHPPIADEQPIASEEQLLSPEGQREIIDAVNNELAEEMRRLHENDPFHNEGHIEDVGGDALAILAIFEKYGMINEEDALAVTGAANGHDLAVNYTVVEDKAAFNYGQRARHRGFGGMMPANIKAMGIEKGNEEVSWDKTRETIARIDPDKKVYTDQVLEKIRLCIAATYPDAMPATFPEGATIITNPENGEQIDLSSYVGKDKDGKPMAFKFDQPFLLSETGSGISTLAVAFGDLMYGGKCSPEDFIRHGNDEYQELRKEGIVSEVAGGIGALSPERKVEIAKDAIAWIGTQTGFLLWQKLRFQNILDVFKPINESPYGEGIKRDLSELYGKFDQNLLASKNRADAAQRFESLKNPQTYAENPETAQALFADLLSEMGIPQEKVVY